MTDRLVSVTETNYVLGGKNQILNVLDSECYEILILFTALLLYAYNAICQNYNSHLW